MNYVKIKSSLVLFFTFIFGMCSPALSDVCKRANLFA